MCDDVQLEKHGKKELAAYYFLLSNQNKIYGIMHDEKEKGGT